MLPNKSSGTSFIGSPSGRIEELKNYLRTWFSKEPFLKGSLWNQKWCLKEPFVEGSLRHHYRFFAELFKDMVL